MMIFFDTPPFQMEGTRKKIRFADNGIALFKATKVSCELRVINPIFRIVHDMEQKRDSPYLHPGRTAPGSSDERHVCFSDSPPAIPASPFQSRWCNQIQNVYKGGEPR